MKVKMHPYLLSLIAVDCTGTEFSTQLIGKLVTHSLGRAEDDDSCSAWLRSQDLHQASHLFVHSKDLHGMSDC